jgi:hypothetical protein
VADGPNPRRFAWWAALVSLPLVVTAVLLPRLLRGGAAAPSGVTGAASGRGEPAPGALGAVASGIGLVTGSAPGGAAAAATAPEGAAARREGPTVEQIEAWRAASEEQLRAERGWRKVEFMAPRAEPVEPNGERVVPFEGFGLSLDSTPPGAKVTIDGRVLGVTPLVTSLTCRPGDAIAIEVSLQPHGTQRRQVRCRADALVSLTIPLAR